MKMNKPKEWEKTEADELIIKSYEQTNSITKTCEETGENKIRVRRVLITEGKWESRRSREVGELYENGENPEEIAEKLSLSIKTVQSLLPYKRGKRYEKTPETKDSARSYNYRKRMRAAEKNQKGKNREEEKEMAVGLDGSRVNLTLQSGVNFFQSLGISDADTSYYEDMLSAFSLILPDDVAFDPDNPDPSFMERTFKLRITLDLKGASMAAIRKFGKAEHSISREIVVPGSMPLSRFHLLLQRAFGWQDAHHHKFYLEDDALINCTSGTLDGFIPLCGDLFAFAPPGEPLYREGLSYEPTMSIRSWLKLQYMPPYCKDLYVQPRLDAKEAILSFVKYELPHTIAALNDSGILKGDSPRDIAIKDFQKYIPYTGELLDATTLSNVFAHTDSFSYSYDPEKDKWKVKVSLIASSNVLGTVTPFCTASDGLAVMERIGGPRGYSNFLKDTWNLGNKDLDWIAALSEDGDIPHGNIRKLAAARDKGWSGRLISPKFLL